MLVGSRAAAVAERSIGRGGEHAERFLDGFGGILQVDGYAGYNRLTRQDRPGGPLRLAYCWAHARRKLHEIARGRTAPIAEEGLRRIAEIYRELEDPEITKKARRQLEESRRIYARSIQNRERRAA